MKSMNHYARLHNLFYRFFSSTINSLKGSLFFLTSLHVVCPFTLISVLLEKVACLASCVTVNLACIAQQSLTEWVKEGLVITQLSLRLFLLLREAFSNISTWPSYSQTYFQKYYSIISMPFCLNPHQGFNFLEGSNFGHHKCSQSWR